MVTAEDLVDGPTLKESSRTSSIRVFDQLDGFTDTDNDAKVSQKISKWCGIKATQARDGAKTFSFTDWLALALPCMSWLKTYSVRALKRSTFVYASILNMRIVFGGVAWHIRQSARPGRSRLTRAFSWHPYSRTCAGP